MEMSPVSHVRLIKEKRLLSRHSSGEIRQKEFRAGRSVNTKKLYLLNRDTQEPLLVWCQ